MCLHVARHKLVVTQKQRRNEVNMRITNQMINKIAVESGLPVHQTSLLDYINNDNTANTSLLDALNNNKSNVSNATAIENYGKLEKTADQLLQNIEVFTKEGEESVFEKAKESGDYQTIYDGIETVFNSYNDTLAALKTASTPLNDYYRQMLQAAALENNEAFANIGISISKDGTATVDTDKLKAADISNVEEIFGASGTFLAKVEILSERISANAKANTESLTSGYNSSGYAYSSLTSKYNFWG